MRGRRGRYLEDLGRVGRRGSYWGAFGAVIFVGAQAPYISRRTGTAGMYGQWKAATFGFGGSGRDCFQGTEHSSFEGYQ